ncbi:hypothetical protein Enr13x_67580 [Stieleria neptunia]|uniref:Uncharacterized protein n=1 Tax=Stieleria neptunia TaxID=2527979 RepID=A0A518I147_9BACT|nr:hypothetical protein Enr13x_67580 [Stieleria neptunia]
MTRGDQCETATTLARTVAITRRRRVIYHFMQLDFAARRASRGYATFS